MSFSASWPHQMPIAATGQTVSTGESLWRVLSMSDHNTRVVLLGTTLLGIAAGLLGVYMLLRKRALLGDAISHATLPGVAVAFLWSLSLGRDKSLATLLTGAAISGGLGGLAVMGLRHAARLREDAALGIVLSVFFGAGVALVGIVQQIPGGNAAGLEGFIYGKVATMTAEDAWLGGLAALLVGVMAWLLRKELQLLCFDSELARSQGWPVLVLDTVLIAMVVTVTIVGLQAVGLILVIALLIVPAAAARFWSDRIQRILPLSGVFGGLSCAIGTVLSATYEKLPAGATIVLVASAVFAISFSLGAARGVIWLGLRQRTLRRQQDIQHFMRIAYEILEAENSLADPQDNRSSTPIALSKIAHARIWNLSHVRSVAKRLEWSGMIIVEPSDIIRVTPRGMLLASRVVREHRLLEMYLIRQTSVDGGQADRDADLLEHGLLPEHLRELDESLGAEVWPAVPASPHALERNKATSL